ncbi:hypothetical protein SAMN06295967_11637 [Belliella buryatensis]|uniref:Uncharacterized protein n=1 Tax=Belliella buryatensis TaxID=1500549 RepID=A0A239GH94_9BACT|nr:hypothetical protein [Belliella buryatensis]SNS68510.1 hypothetical protein SAMN06295967_11637 [Belliella buryatensis]
MNIITKPKTKVDTEILEQILTEENVERQVIVKCYLENGPMEQMIRIWQSTFLIPKESSDKSKLLNADNITFFPFWTFIKPKQKYQFTLIFEGLPRGCKFFDLIEEIPQSGGFSITNIPRNQMDVYHVQI